jgi:hypothetical protein
MAFLLFVAAWKHGEKIGMQVANLPIQLLQVVRLRLVLPKPQNHSRQKPLRRLMQLKRGAIVLLLLESEPELP